MQDLVVRPSAGRRIVVALSFVIFAAIGVYAMANGQLLLGFLLFTFAFVGRLIVHARRRETAITFTLTPTGILVGRRIGFVGWQHVGRVGYTEFLESDGLGVEVLDLPAYVATLPPAERFPDDRVRGLERSAKLWDGYHLVFPAMSLARPIRATAQQIEEYRAAAPTALPPEPEQSD